MFSISVKKIAYTFCPGFLHPMLARVESSPIGARLAKGVFWTMTGAITLHGLTLLAAVCVARILGKTGFGELGMIRSTIAMFGVFAGFGLGVTATKHVAECRDSDPERAGRIIALSATVAFATGGLMALALFLYAPWVATHTINAPHLANVLRIAAIALFFSALNGAQTGALSGFEAFKRLAHINALVGLLSLPMLVSGTYLAGLTGAVAAVAANAACCWLLMHIALRREAYRHGIRLAFRGCGSEWPVLWKFSLPALLATSLNIPVNWACSALLVNQPGGYSEMAILSVANQWYGMLLYVPGALRRVVLPVFSERLGQEDDVQSLRMMFLTIKVNGLLVLPVVAMASLISPFIMGLYGGEFVRGWPTLVVVLLTAGVLAIEMPVGPIIAASGKMWLSFAMNGAWALVFIATTLLLVSRGSVGVATARAIAYAMHGTWLFAIVAWLFRKHSVHWEF